MLLGAPAARRVAPCPIAQAARAKYEGGNKRRSPPKPEGSGTKGGSVLDGQSGYFRPEDPSQDVVTYRPRGAGGGDPLARGGRWDQEFIWNTNWREALDYDADLARQKREAEEDRRAAQRDVIRDARPAMDRRAAREGSGRGFLSLTSVDALDDLSIDLSERLASPAPPPAAHVGRVVRRNVGGGGQADCPRPADPTPLPARVSRNPGQYARLPPSKGEARRWDRSRAAVARATGAAPRASDRPRSREDPVTGETIRLAPGELGDDELAELAEGRRKYEEEKGLQLRVTVGLAVTVSLLLAVGYPDVGVAASFAVGSVGSVAYLRSLAQQVEAVGGGGAGAAPASPRLLIPVILVLGADRWNTLSGSDVHLLVLPEILGFFTYKAAVVGVNGWQVAQEWLASDAAADRRDRGLDGGGKEGGAGAATAPGEAARGLRSEDAEEPAATVDRAFKR